MLFINEKSLLKFQYLLTNLRDPDENDKFKTKSFLILYGRSMSKQ